MHRDTRTYSIKELIEIYLSKHKSIGFKLKSHQVLSVWQEVTSDFIKKRTKAVQFKNGVLFVNTESSVIANELSLKEKKLIRNINNKLHVPLVKEIVFKSGFTHAGNVSDTTNKKEDNESNKSSLSINTIKKIDKMVKDIKEDELRNRLKNLFIAQALKNNNYKNRD